MRGGDALPVFTRLLEYSRLRRAPLDIAVVPLRPLVDAAVQQFEGDIRRLRADVVIAPEFPAVWAASTPLQNVVATLLQHGLRNAPSGKPPRVQISAVARGPFILLTVAHDGIGVPLELEQAIFDLGPRLGGFGALTVDQIGLAIARRAVVRMDGRIWADSLPGRDTWFSVELPAA